jgi:DNA-binding CsgD family transcriptional regulator
LQNSGDAELDAINSALSKEFVEHENLLTDSIHDLKMDLDLAKARITDLNHERGFFVDLLLGTIIILFLIAVVLFCRFRFLKKEKDELDKIAKLNSFEVEKLRKERVISDMQISRKNQLLEVISQQIGDNKKGFQEEFVKLFKDNKKHDKNFENFKNLTQFVNPDFYGQLDKKASPNKLTILDLKYCAFIHLGLSNIDIAELLNVTQETVKVQKSKLKSKLKLSRKESLFDYLNKSLNYNSISTFSNGNGNKQA